MKKLFSVFLFVAALTIALPGFTATKTNPKEEKDIKALFSKVEDAWAKGDSKGKAAGFALDAVLINPSGVKAEGKAAIEKLFDDEGKTFAKGTKISFTNYSFLFMNGGSLAYIDADWTMTGMKSPDGKDMAPMVGHLVGLLNKGEQGWMVWELRPYVYTSMVPPTLPEPAAETNVTPTANTMSLTPAENTINLTPGMK